MPLNDYRKYVKCFSIRQIQKYTLNEPDGHLLALNLSELKRCVSNSWPQTQVAPILNGSPCNELGAIQTLSAYVIIWLPIRLIKFLIILNTMLVCAVRTATQLTYFM